MKRKNKTKISRISDDFRTYCVFMMKKKRFV